MLKPKQLPAASGAEHLASLMVDYTQGMNVHSIALDSLVDAPAEWNFFRPLPPGKFFELTASIEESGLLTPLIVWEMEPRQGEIGGRYMILSGHNRKNALKALHDRTGDSKYGKASCVVYRKDALTAEEARAIIVDCNWVQRTLSASEKARAIFTKYVELGRRKAGEGGGGRRYDEVAEHFGLKATQVYHYYRLARLDSHWLNMLDKGEINIKAASRLCSLTDEQLEILRQQPGLTSKEILSIDACFTTEELQKAVDRQDAPMRELRVLVPANLYAKALALINEFVARSDEE